MITEFRIAARSPVPAGQVVAVVDAAGSGEHVVLDGTVDLCGVGVDAKHDQVLGVAACLFERVGRVEDEPPIAAPAVGFPVVAHVEHGLPPQRSRAGCGRLLTVGRRGDGFLLGRVGGATSNQER